MKLWNFHVRRNEYLYNSILRFSIPHSRKPPRCGIKDEKKGNDPQKDGQGSTGHRVTQLVVTGNAEAQQSGDERDDDEIEIACLGRAEPEAQEQQPGVCEKRCADGFDEEQCDVITSREAKRS